MARKSKALIELEVAAFHAARGMLLSLPPDRRAHMARMLGRLAMIVDRRHSAVALDNLRRACPGLLPERAARALVRRVWENLAWSLSEVLTLDRFLTPGAWRRVVAMDVHPETRRLIDSGRGLMFFSGHLGNWELNATVFAWAGMPMHAIGRPLDNPKLNARLVAYRGRFGGRMIAKEGALRSMIRVLRDGGNLVMLLDQAMGSEGRFVEFFGQPACTATGAASLALRLDAPIIPCFTWRAGPLGTHRLALLKPLLFQRSNDAEADALRLTQVMTLLLEAAVRRLPDQWLWLHRRWKTYGRDPLAEGYRRAREILTDADDRLLASYDLDTLLGSPRLPRPAGDLV